MTRSGFVLPSIVQTSLGAVCAVGLLSLGCESEKVDEPKATAASTATATAQSTASAPKPLATTSAAPASTTPPKPTPPKAPQVAARPVATVAAAPDDPLKGKFTIDDALKGLPGSGKLIAVMTTEKGKLECELWPDKAPLTVANFVGLARGLRPWKTPDGKWVKKPLYDGTGFHRIIKGFMIQGGDPKGNGSGEPGYVIPDEIWENGSHNERGLLCMANRGPNTNGAQFFILDAPSTYLDNNYTIFGKCSPDSVIETLASHKVMGDRAIDPPKISKVTIERRKE